MTFTNPRFERRRVTLDCDPAEGKTKQEFKKQCDINNILKKADKTGLITHVNTATARFDDFTSDIGFHEAMNMVVNAQESFDALPSDIRKKFHNDPAEFLEAIDKAHEGDKDMQDMLVKMGIRPAPVPAPDTVHPAVKDEPKDPPKTQ